MVDYYNRDIIIGGTVSPLDVVLLAVNASGDYLVRRTIYNGYLSELWVDAVNTTSGESFGFIMEYNGAAVTMHVCPSIDTGLAADAQTNTAPSSYADGNFSTYGRYLLMGTELVTIGRDFIYCNWELERKSNTPLYNTGVFIGVPEKTSTYSGGITFLIGGGGAGESYTNVFYDGLWYGDSVAANSNNRMCRINGLHVTGHYSIPLAAPRYFYSKISIHVNTLEFGTNNQLVLLGFLPNGIVGTRKGYVGFRDLTIELPEGTFLGAPDTQCEAIDTLLFPIA